MGTKVKGDAIKEGSIPFNALDKNISKDIPIVVGNYDEESLNRFKYIVDNLDGTVYCIMRFGDMTISGRINDTWGGRLQIMGVVILSSTDKFKEGDGIRIGGGSGEFLTPLCENYAEVTSCGLTYENTTSVDPVVWKYICNPYIACVGGIEEDIEEVPEDLRSIIIKDETLSDIILNLVYFKDMDDSDEPIYRAKAKNYDKLICDNFTVTYNYSTNKFYKYYD